MMAFFFGQRAYSISKGEGLRKITEAKGAREPSNTVDLTERPLRDLWAQLLDIRFGY
jgi:hypothetical protein